MCVFGSLFEGPFLEVFQGHQKDADHFGAGGCIGQALESNRTLKELDLAGNEASGLGKESVHLQGQNTLLELGEKWAGQPPPAGFFILLTCGHEGKRAIVEVSIQGSMTMVHVEF